MRICVFTENHYKGGLDTFIINLLNSWPNGNDDITLVCNDSHPGLNDIAFKTTRPITIIRYSGFFKINTGDFQHSKYKFNSDKFRYIAKLFRGILYPIQIVFYTIALYIYFKNNKHDRLLVVNGGYPASLICRISLISWRLSCPEKLGILSIHSLAQPSAKLIGFIDAFIDILLSKSIHCILTVSSACADSLINRSHVYGAVNISYIYNGIDDPCKSLYEKDGDSDRYIFNAGRYCLMLGTYHEYKGHKYLLQAFAEVVKEIPDIKLIICGYGKDHEIERVSNYVKQYGLNNHTVICDFIQNPYRLIAESKILLVPSQAFESFGLTIIEAMSLSVPVVATNVGGIPEVLCDTNAGYVCSKNNPKEFACAIIKILKYNILSQNMGSNGRAAFLSKYTSEGMSKKYYEKII